MEELRDKGPVHVQSREIKGLLNKDDTHVWELSRFSHVLLCVTLWTVAHQVPLSLGFSRQEYRSGLPCPPPGDLSHPGIEPVPLISPALAGWFFSVSATWEAGRVSGDIKIQLTDPWAQSQVNRSASQRSRHWSRYWSCPLATYLKEPRG